MTVLGWYSNVQKLARLREGEGGLPVVGKSHLRAGVLPWPLLNREFWLGWDRERRVDKIIQRVSEDGIPS